MSNDVPLHHRARKRFGQHFLEPVWVNKVIAAIDPKPEDVFLEIGPGHGALTRPLAARAKAIVAFEIDRDLAGDLANSAPDNVQVVVGDFLAAEDYRLAANAHVRVAGNLPYNVAAPILFKLAGMHADGIRLADATVMLQREVADRLVAVPGTKDYGVLTVLIRHAAEVTRLLNLPPGAFRPMPKVQSTIVRLRFHAGEPSVRNINVFRQLVQAVFTRRRKTLANALLAFTHSSGPAPIRTGVDSGPTPTVDSGPTPTRTGVEPESEPEYALRQAALDGRRRPETLTVAEFARLADVFSAAPQKN
jgi:16S rRNA (adenine1518-N6/adenine1519-N6)-dimethyltransferase